MIQVFKPFYGDEEIKAVNEVLKSGWVGLGPKTKEFEDKFAEHCKTKYCIGLNSGTTALDLSLKLLGVNHGDEVIVPTWTFVSTAHCVYYNLATPIFADIDPDTMNINLEDVAKKITCRTKAIIPVHFSGRPVDIDKLKEIAGDIPIVEDCAHASGAKYKNKSVGGLADIGAHSFHAVKNLAMGEGGAITLNNEEMAERAIRLRWLGIDKSTWDRTSLEQKYWWEYAVDEIGYKYHLNDIHAALGLVQLKKLHESNSLRRERVNHYFEGLTDIEQIQLPPKDDNVLVSSWHLFAIRTQSRDKLSVYLQENDINTGVHYKPIHTYKCYGNRTYLPIAEKVFKEALTLPLYPSLSNDDHDKIIDLIRKFFKNS